MKKIFSFLFLFTMYSVVLFAQAVDPSGAFTYSIPIEVPLGTGNLTPKISLYYNSNAGNGICGVGWNLAGLSAICRDASYAINFDAEDHYLLDGQKLIEINSTSTYQEYRTERESFLRIRGYHLNTAASYWEVASKSGQVMYYGRIDAQHGTSNDGHIDAVEKSGKARVWGISHMEDARGNYYYVTYWEDEENGDYYPLQIIYSQNDANRLTSMRTVSFSYEKRDDHYATYNPSMVDTDYRLKWIAVTTKTNTDGRNGKLIRKYRVDYEYSESTSRSRITGIQPYGSDGDIPNIPAVASSYGGTGTSLPATDIQWEDGKPGWESVPEYAPPYHFMSDEYNQDFSVRTVDFDGDGLVDILYHRYSNGTSQKGAYRNTGSGWESVPEYAPPYHFMSDEYNQDFSVRTVDFDGDGLVDILYHRYSNGTSQKGAYRNTGSGWESVPEYTPPYHFMADEYPNFSVRTVDFDGDGLVDILYHRYSNGTSQKGAYRNTGSGWESVPEYTPPYHFMADEYPNFSVRTVDFDGDGLVDILYHRYSNGTSQKGAYRNTGSGWESAPEYAPPYHFMADEYSQDFSVRTVDINGDGLVDILYHRYMRNGVSQKEAYLNTKSGWKAAPEYAPPYHFMADEYNQDFSVRTVDINGDGLVDILYHRYMRNGVSQKGAYLNTKSGWKAAPEYAPPYHFMADGYPNFSVRTVDFDGDGLVDILYHRYSNGVSQKGAYRNTGRKELISLIKNSSGCLYSPKYTQVSHVNGAICPGNSSYPVISNASSRMLVTKLSIDDGMGNTTATEYSYHNGLFQSGYRYERKNLGFEWTEAHNQETGLTTRTWYNQDPDTFYGLVVKTEVYRGRDYNNAKFFSVKENSYANNAENGAIELRRVVERFYNFTDEPVTTMVEYPEYDALGNRLKTVDYGEVSWPGLNNLDAYDDITKEFEYITLDSGSRYISVPSMEQTYAYTLGNRLATVSETRYLYDGNTTGGYVDEGLVTRKEFENGLDDSAVEYGYDDYGNLIWMDDARVVSKEVSPASGHSSKLTYDSDFATYVVSKTDADGNAETVVYDERMQPIKVSDINGVAWKKVYDEFGRVVKEIAPGDSETAPTKRYTYSTPLSDGLPNWVKTEVKESAQGETASYLVAYVYTDGLGRELQRKSEATGGRWTTIDSHYDSAGREWRTSVPYYSTSYYYNYGNERKSSDRVCSELVYDDTSRVVRTIHTDKTATKALYGKRAVIHMDPAGHVTAREVSGRSVYEYTYEDNFSSSWDVLNAETFIDQNRSYTSTKVTNFGDGTTITDQDGNVITTRLDMLGNKISYDDPDKGLWTYAYDENGNLLTQQDAEGNTVKFTYDSLNRVVKKTVNGEAAAIFSYGTDPAVFEIGQLVEVSFNGNSDAFTYDQRGRVVSHTRELAGISKTMQYSLYDSMDRIRREINPDGEELIHSYLHDGNLGSVENASGYTYISALDYEPFGNIQGFTYGNGVSTQYSYYDGSDGQPCSYRLRNIAIQKGGTVIGNTYYKYDDTDNITLKSFTDDFNGAYTEHFRYDHRNRLSNYDTDIRGTTENKRYVYDNVDNIYQKNGLSYFYCGPKPHAITEQRDSGGNTIRAFEYNANGDMTRATNYSAITITAGAEGVNGGQPILELWVGESLEMSWCLKDEEVRAYTWHGYWNGSDPIYVHYAADRAGSSAGIRIDRVAVNDEVIESEDSAKVYFVTGSFDPVNGVTGTQIVGLSDSELMDQHGALCFTNITSVPEERDFFYDGENRLKTLQEGTKFSSYAYDPWGERVSVIADGARTYFFFKGYEVRFEGTTTTVSSGYFANEIRIAQRKSVYEDSALASEELLYVHIDHLGSAVRMTDESGAVVSSLAYSPYGETLYASGDENTPYQFTGQHNDGNGIYYYGARYYDPYLGRFLQADSVLDGLNRYAYCRNNPVVYTDPTGEAGWLTFSIGPNGFSIGVNNGLFGGGINISWNDGGSIGLYGEIGPHAPDGFAATATAGVDYHFGNGDVTGTIGGGAGYYTGTSGYIGLNVNSTYNFTQNEYYGGSVGIGFGNSSGLSINAGFYWNWDGDFRYSGNTFSVGVGYTGEHAKIGAGGSVTGYNDGRGFDISWNANAALDVVYYHKDYRYEKNGRHLTFDEVKELGLSDLPPKMKIFHDNHDMYPELKYLSYCGFLGISSREYVFDGKTLLPMTDPKYIATYNYISPVLPPKKWYNVPGWTNFTVRALGHGIFDVLPYKILGN